MPWAEADANYYYKLQLQLKDAGNAEASATWTGWIHVEAELDEANKVTNWKNSLKKLIIDKVSVKDVDGKEVKLYESSTATERKYTVVGIAFKGDGNVGSDGWNNQILDGEDYQYTVKEDGKDTVISVFPVIKPEIEYLDLSDWGKLFYEGKYYFSGMDSLKKVKLPNNEFAIRSVGLFSSNENLEELEWGDKTVITEIGQEAFSSCPKLKAECIQKAINECAAYNLEKNKPGDNYETMTDEQKAEFFKEHGTYENIKYGVIGKMAFHDCMQTGGTTHTLIIPKGIIEIGEQAFDQTQNGTQLKTVKFDCNDIKIDDYAFDGCRDVEDLTLGQDVKVIHLGEGVFRNNRMIKSASVNGILENFSANCASKDEQGEVSIPAKLFEGCNGNTNTKDENGNTVFQPNFTELVIPANVKSIGACAFGSRDGVGTMFLNKITVSRGTAPNTGYYYTDRGEGWSWNFYPFNDLIANQCTIIFKGDAAKYNSDNTTGYKSYMTDGQEFQRLLTKDIYSDNSDAAKAYNVVAQQHAIVRLHRSLVAGWNTLCLPFGVTNASAAAAGGADVKNCSIIKNALNLSNSTDNTFMIALYRDYVPSKDLLRFLHITDANKDYTYAKAEIPAYQPFMVKMGSNDLAATDGEYFINRQSHKDAFYTFNNVDLNYAGWTVDGENNYTANISETPAPSEWKGQPELFAPFNDGKGNTNTYAFVGSFNTSIITPSAETNDYFIQTNNGITKFYKYESGKKYGVRAFSGWFKYVGSKDPAHAKPASVLINIMGDNYETTEIVRVDADGNESVTGNIYNINGQLVRANATGTEGLQKGIYIMNGKKFVVK